MTSSFSQFCKYSEIADSLCESLFPHICPVLKVTGLIVQARSASDFSNLYHLYTGLQDQSVVDLREYLHHLCRKVICFLELDQVQCFFVIVDAGYR